MKILKHQGQLVHTTQFFTKPKRVAKPKRDDYLLQDPPDTDVLLLAQFNIAKLEPKFREGMEKYTTPIFRKSGLKEMLPEMLDLFAYHATAQLQWSKVHRLLDELCIEKPGLNKHPYVKKMFEILGDKPLAKKKGAK